MNTTRRTFLTRLIAAAGLAPLVARAAKPTPPTTPDLKVMTYPLDSKIRYAPMLVKVPSNRQTYWDYTSRGIAEPYMVRYEGDWDGTFKEERGCTNPAYILADLYERTGAEPNWVVGVRAFEAPGISLVAEPRALDWQMLYDWGRWCDELVPETEQGVIAQGCDGKLTLYGIGRGASVSPCRLIVHAAGHTREDMVQLRETLRMHCLSWQSTDPRYRTSWPGVPYPVDDIV